MKTIAVFCGSSIGIRAEYATAAAALGQTIAERGMTLVYGGASVGLMGVVANAAISAGGSVVGVIPEALQRKEIMHHGLSELHVVDSMHTRKRMMADRADAFIALPGGIGTFEELFEVWTWGMLGHHDKPCAVLDVAGYYDRLIEFLDHVSAEGFVRADHRAMLLVDTLPSRLLDRLATYQPPKVAKWIDAEET